MVIVAGSGLRVREVFLRHPLDHLFSDAGRHWDHAHEALNNRSPMVLIDPPIYQMLLSLVQKWSFGDRTLVALYSAVVSVGTPFLWYLFLREYLESRLLALTGWAIFARLPSWFSIFSYLMSETLFLPLLGACLWQTVRVSRNGSVKAFCWMVTLWTLTGLTRAIAFPLGAVAGVGVWLRHPKKLPTFAWGALIAFVLMAPFSLRNYEWMNLWPPMGSGWQASIYALSGNKNIELHLTRDGAGWEYGFGSPSLYSPQLEPFSHWQSSRTGTAVVHVDLRKGDEAWAAEARRLSKHGAALERLRLENVILLMFGESWPDGDPASNFPEAARTLRWIWAPLFLMVLVGSAIHYRVTLRRPLIPAMILTWFIFQGVFIVIVNEGRYRKPLEGLLIVQLLVWADYVLSQARAGRLGHGAAPTVEEAALTESVTGDPPAESPAAEPSEAKAGALPAET